MTKRAYTVAELDALRRVVETKWLYGFYVLTPQMCQNGYGMSRGYKAEEKEKAVEERVRTHMLAGHAAEDLIASEFERVGRAASGIETGGHDGATRHGAEHESPAPKGDAQ